MKNFFLKILTILVFFISCEKNEIPDFFEPEIISTTTTNNVEITHTTIRISGNVLSDGGYKNLIFGVCWSTNENPTINDNKTIESTKIFSSLISDLTVGTKYYFRVYATSKEGTIYGVSQSFTTLSLSDTKWDFIITVDSSPVGSWHADVVFKEDGTTIYDEPAFPGIYLTNGTWSLNENNLSYDLNSSSSSSAYQFIGTIVGDSMSGTFTYGNSSDKVWSAKKY